MSGATSGTLQRMPQADALGASDTTVLLGCVQAFVVDARASGPASRPEIQGRESCSWLLIARMRLTRLSV